MASLTEKSPIGTIPATKAGLGSIHVEVIYALPQHQELIHLELPEGSTLQQALEASGMLQKYPEIEPAKNKLGIYGKLAKPDTTLREHDRIEIYRPLIADPKEKRKQRAAEGGALKRQRGSISE